MTGALRAMRHPRLAIAAWVAMFAFITIGSLLPADDIPQSAFNGMDKVEHLTGYAGLSAYAVMLFATRRARWSAGAGVALFGMLIELAQGAFTTTRQPDVFDALANATGAALGQLLVFTPLAHWLVANRLRARV